MRISETVHSNRLFPVVLMLGSLGFVSGCGDNGSGGGTGSTEAVKAKEESERAARQKEYGAKGVAPGTKKEAEAAKK